jgi:hypothetical protein
MPLHSTTFEYLKPTDAQLERMADVRARFAAFVQSMEAALPDGPDKTFVIRNLRDCAMWANVTITRGPDGAPRG